MAYGIPKDNSGRVVKSVIRGVSSYAVHQRKVGRMISKMSSLEKISHYKCEVWASYIVTLLIAFSGLKGWFYWWCLFCGVVFTVSAMNKLVDSGYK